MIAKISFSIWAYRDSVSVKAPLPYATRCPSRVSIAPSPFSAWSITLKDSLLCRRKYLRRGALVTSCFTCSIILHLSLWDLQDVCTHHSSVVKTCLGKSLIQWTSVHWPHRLSSPALLSPFEDLLWDLLRYHVAQKWYFFTSGFCLFFSFTFCSRHICNKARKFLSWSLSSCFSVEPSPKIRISSWIKRTHFRLPRTWRNLRWNSSDAVLIQKGNRHHLNVHANSVLKLVNREYWSSSSTCRKPVSTSTFANTFTLAKSRSISSIEALDSGFAVRHNSDLSDLYRRDLSVGFPYGENARHPWRIYRICNFLYDTEILQTV